MKSFSTWLLFGMQLKTLNQGNKCSWHDCSWLMSFHLIAIDFIYMTFTSPFNHWHCGGHGKAPTPIELIQGSLFPQLIARDLTRVIYVCWHTGGLPLFTQPSLLSRQSRHRSRRVYGHYACDPIVRGWDPTSIIPPRSRWPAVPASSISHYCVTVAASLSTPSVMYGLTLCGIQKPQLEVQWGEEHNRGCSTI